MARFLVFALGAAALWVALWGVRGWRAYNRAEVAMDAAMEKRLRADD